MFRVSFGITNHIKRLSLLAALFLAPAAAIALPTAVIDPKPYTPIPNVGQTITLSSTGSQPDPDGGGFIFSRQWILPAPLPPENGFSTSFAAPAVAGAGPQFITVQLNVQDFTGVGSDSINIRVNRLPTATPQNLSTEEDTPLPITLSGSDADLDGLTFELLSAPNPAAGSLSGAAPNLTFTPAANYVGPASFTFRVNDGFGNSTAATIAIDVTPGNDPPTANGQNRSTNEDVALPITLTGTDPDGDPLSFNVVSGPSNGVLSGTPPNVTYTPNANFNGSDSFNFTVSDAEFTSAQATVNITVNAVDDAPVAEAGPNLTTPKGTSIVLQGSAEDVEGDPINYSWSPAGLLVNPNSPTPTFNAPGNLTSEQTFVFTLTASGSGGQTTDTMNVVVTNGLPPIANAGADNSKTSGDTVVLLGTSSDPDGQLPLQFLWTQIGGPIVTLSDPTVEQPSFEAPSVSTTTLMTFRFRVTDSGGNTANDDVTWRIFPVGSALPQNPLLTDLAVFPSPFTASEGSTIRYELLAPSEVKILIVDVFGRVVREFSSSAGTAGGVSGTNTIRWDGKNGEGNAIGNGAYIVQVRAADGSGQKGKMTERVGVRN